MVNFVVRNLRIDLKILIDQSANLHFLNYCNFKINKNFTQNSEFKNSKKSRFNFFIFQIVANFAMKFFSNRANFYNLKLHMLIRFLSSNSLLHILWKGSFVCSIILTSDHHIFAINLRSDDMSLGISIVT